MELPPDIAEIVKSYRAALADCDSLTLNRKPARGEWSIAEVLSHLLKTNASYFAIFDEVAAGTYAVPRKWLRIPARWMGPILLGVLQADAERHAQRAPKTWLPEAGQHDLSIVQRFIDQQRELAGYREKLRPYMGKGIIVESPVSNKVLLPLDMIVDILLAHEERHLKQCVRVLEAIGRK